MKTRTKIIMSIIIFFAICLFNKQVLGFTVVIDPGHGGTDPGAIATNGEYEKDLNLKIAEYLKEYLEEYDVTVYMTHEGFSGYKYELIDRALYAREKNADLVISIHLNSSESTSQSGAEVWVTQNTSLDKYNKNCTELGNKILSNLGKLGISSRGVKTSTRSDVTDVYSDGTRADYYGIICYCMRGCKIDNGVISPTGAVPADIENGEGVPAIIIEHCFLIGSDYQYIDSDSDLKQLAEADGKAVVEQYGLTLKKELGDTPFEDVYTSDWYYSAVKYTYDNGMISGTTSTTFEPNIELTRGMLVSILYKMEGGPSVSEGETKFSDVTDSRMYYYSAVKWASENGIVSGYDDGTFGPNDLITREQLAVMLRNYCMYKGKYVESSTELDDYPDGDTVSKFALTAMQWAVENKVITGSNGSLNPKSTATRAEAVSMIYKYCMNVK